MRPELRGGRNGDKTMPVYGYEDRIYTFSLPGESEPRRCTFQEMMRIIKERCPNGKMKEILLA